MDKLLLSIIIPVYNEKENVSPLLKRLIPAIKKYEYEIVDLVFCEARRPITERLNNQQISNSSNNSELCNE